jgi:hypothetical protein
MTPQQKATLDLIHDSFRSHPRPTCFDVMPAFDTKGGVHYHVWYGADADGEETAGSPDLTIAVASDGTFSEVV